MTRSALEAAIVADDLTGALDTAAPFADVGLETRVLPGTMEPASIASTPAAVLAVTTESRHLSNAQASARVQCAMQAVLARSPRILFKKVDSTLRGPVAAEIVAALRASGRRHAVIAPAVPRQRRVMRNGEVFVDGVPLRDTAIGNDPLSASTTEPLPRVLANAGANLVVHALRGDAPLALHHDAGLHAYVVDAETEGELDAIVRFALAFREEVLVVGASGLGDALARALSRDRKRAAPSPSPAFACPRGPIVFIVGSRAEASAAQVDRLRRTGAHELLVPLRATRSDLARLVEAMTAPKGLSAGKARALETTAWIVRPESPVACGVAAADIARNLALAGTMAARKLRAGTLVIVGGDTACATFSALGVREVQVRGQFAPGIPMGEMPVDARSLAFFTKSGGFGEPDVLADIAHSVARIPVGRTPA